MTDADRKDRGIKVENAEKIMAGARCLGVAKRIASGLENSMSQEDADQHTAIFDHIRNLSNENVAAVDIRFRKPNAQVDQADRWGEGKPSYDPGVFVTVRLREGTSIHMNIWGNIYPEALGINSGALSDSTAKVAKGQASTDRVPFDHRNIALVMTNENLTGRKVFDLNVAFRSEDRSSRPPELLFSRIREYGDVVYLLNKKGMQIDVGKQDLAEIDRLLPTLLRLREADSEDPRLAR